MPAIKNHFKIESLKLTVINIKANNSIYITKRYLEPLHSVHSCPVLWVKHKQITCNKQA